MRRALIPQTNNRFFDTLRIVRNLEESSLLIDTYTEGLRIIFPDASERLIHFQREEGKDENLESVQISVANEPEDQILDQPIEFDSGQVSEEEKNFEHFDVIKGIENYSTVVYRKNQTNLTCSICLEDFEEGGEVIRLECFHVFHNLCIRDWAKSNGICPECRREI